jgi:hypothetical protein
MFADIKNIYIFAMSRTTKPTGRVAGTKKMSYENKFKQIAETSC